MAIKCAAVDLTICDLEPIHTPGSIQSHGVMLIVDHDGFLVRQGHGCREGLNGNVGMQAEGKVNQAAGQVGGSSGRAGDVANEVVDEISTTAGEATQTVKGAAGVIGDKVYDAGARTGQYVGQTVKQQPMLSIIGAAAIGHAVAFLLHSPSSLWLRRSERGAISSGRQLASLLR